MKKIGIYGGTFDPIHNAHLILAREALEQLQLDQVVFVPAAVSPHKLAETLSPAPARVEMVRAAIAGEPGFRMDELEINRPAPSFTIDTIEEFQRCDPHAEMYCLVGSDNLPRLHTWHRIDDLRKLVRFVVLNRAGTTDDTGYITIRRPIEISGTDIRNRVATGRSVRYLVPRAVEEIIQDCALYKELPRSPRKN